MEKMQKILSGCAAQNVQQSQNERTVQRKKSRPDRAEGDAGGGLYDAVQGSVSDPERNDSLRAGAGYG